MTKETTLLGRELEKIADRIKKYQSDMTLKTEESTKMALIVDFLRALGYEVTEPEDIIPESAADMDIKQQKKVDYMLLKDGKPVIIVECKKITDKEWNSNKYWQQLYNYFHSLSSKPDNNRFAILTNGIKYWFYSDLVERHRMDKEPFFEFDLLNPQHFDKFFLGVLNQFSQSKFDVNINLKTANELRIYSVMREFVEKLLQEPDKNKDFVISFLKEANISDKWEREDKLFRQYSHMLKDAFDSYIYDRDLVVDNLSTEEIDIKQKLYALVKSLFRNPSDSFIEFCWRNSEVYKKGSWKKLVVSEFKPIIQTILKEYLKSKK